MPHIILTDRKVIIFDGPDAEHLLHNVVTCNIENLPQGVAQIGALLTPQGKILFEFLVSKQSSNRFLIEIDTQSAAAFIQRMTMYRLRSKVEIAESSESVVGISWGADSTTGTDGLSDCRFLKIDVSRHYLDDSSATERQEWDELKIAFGVPESGRDYELGDVFPHDVSFDQNGGVDFKKGCYIGQEVVSRMHHRHTARRRVLIARATENFTDDQVNIVANEKPLGTLGTRVANQALAMCRIDRVKDAMDAEHAITSNNIPLALTLPADVTYDWPRADSDG